jgi:hypothetical protein
MILPEIGAIDGRTRAAHLYKEVACAIAADLGGPDQLSKAERELVKRSAQRAGRAWFPRRAHRGDPAVSNNLELAQVAAA